MLTIRQMVLDFLNFDGVNKAYVAEQLYGVRGAASTAKLRNKILNIDGRSFTDEEIEKLYKIRQNFLKKLL